MIQEVIWYETREVKRGFCVDCFILHSPVEFPSNLEGQRTYIERYQKYEIPPVYDCVDCGRFVYYIHNDDRPGWWTEKDITENFKGVFL